MEATNFPGCNWKTKCLKPGSAYPNLHTKFTEILDNNSLIQKVEKPTTINSTLDLIITNQPSKVLRVDVWPVVSDNEIVFAELDDLRPVKHNQKSRQIPLYKKAKWDHIREDMAALRGPITIMYEATADNVNEMWKKFRDTHEPWRKQSDTIPITAWLQKGQIL